MQQFLEWFPLSQLGQLLGNCFHKSLLGPKLALQQCYAAISTHVRASFCVNL